MKDFLKYTYSLGFVAMLLTACSSDEEAVPAPEAGVPIRFQVDNQVAEGKSRAALLDDEASIEEQGFFKLLAYHQSVGQGMDESGASVSSYQKYMEVDVKYFKEADEAGSDNVWRCWSGNDYYQTYWPAQGTLDLFAYMPYDISPASINYISNIGHTQDGGPSFSAALPTSNTDDAAKTEFIYAYSKEKSEDSNSGWVGLHFVHPFALVKFQLVNSLRLKLEKIVFGNTTTAGPLESGKPTPAGGICVNGNYSNAAKTDFEYAQNNQGKVVMTEQGKQEYQTWVNGAVWNGENSQTYTFTIDKQVPDELNMNTDFGGPSLVIPQVLTDDVTIYIKGKRAGNTNYEGCAKLKTTDVPKWQAGQVYTYRLNLGDTAEEILYDVVVEPWEKINKQIVEVE